MEVDENVASFLLQQQKVDMADLKVKLNEAIGMFPKVKGSEKQYLSQDANRALGRAKKMLAEMDVLQRKMMRRIMGWRRIESEAWEATISRMKHRLENCQSLCYCQPWSAKIMRNQ